MVKVSTRTRFEFANRRSASSVYPLDEREFNRPKNTVKSARTKRTLWNTIIADNVINTGMEIEFSRLGRAISTLERKLNTKRSYSKRKNSRSREVTGLPLPNLRKAVDQIVAAT